MNRTRAVRGRSQRASHAGATRTIAVHLDAAKRQGDAVGFLVGGLGLLGIGVMLAIDALVYWAL